MKAVIIDDEPLARQVVAEYLQAFPQIGLAAECSDGFEGVKALQQHNPDVIFLDIQMPKITGFEMLELVEKPPAVIFTTAFDEYAIKAFETHAVDYLLKPFSPERFNKAVEKVLAQTATNEQKKVVNDLVQNVVPSPSQAERVVIKDGGKIRIINIHQIKFLEAADDYVKLHTADGVFLKGKTMGFYEDSLPKDGFVRTHRSFIVNVQYITRIDPYEKESHIAVLKTGENIFVSKAGYIKLKQVLGL